MRWDLASNDDATVILEHLGLSAFAGMHLASTETSVKASRYLDCWTRLPVCKFCFTLWFYRGF